MAIFERFFHAVFSFSFNSHAAHLTKQLFLHPRRSATLPPPPLSPLFSSLHVQKAKKGSILPVFCTLFGIFGALFLFTVASLMNQEYHYIHMQGNMAELSKSVTYAGAIWFAIAAISVGFMVKDSYVAGQLSAPASSFRPIEE
jgi:hypothetical protein